MRDGLAGSSCPVLVPVRATPLTSVVQKELSKARIKSVFEVLEVDILWAAALGIKSVYRWIVGSDVLEAKHEGKILLGCFANTTVFADSIICLRTTSFMARTTASKRKPSPAPCLTCESCVRVRPPAFCCKSRSRLGGSGGLPVIVLARASPHLCRACLLSVRQRCFCEMLLLKL